MKRWVQCGTAATLAEPVADLGTPTVIVTEIVSALGGPAEEHAVKMPEANAEGRRALTCGSATLTPRKSARLAGLCPDGALDRAVVRKIKLREGRAARSDSEQSRRGRLTVTIGDNTRERKISKIRRKGRECGINLSSEDARCFTEFLEAATV